MFQTTFEKKLVAETSKELVFLLPQRRIRCAATSLFGVAEVAAGLSNESQESKKVEEESRAIRL